MVEAEAVLADKCKVVWQIGKGPTRIYGYGKRGGEKCVLRHLVGIQ